MIAEISAGPIVREKITVKGLVRVLIVDDSAFMRKAIRQILARSPFIEVVGTPHGQHPSDFRRRRPCARTSVRREASGTWPTRPKRRCPGAETATRRAGLEPKRTIVRGGTDGSRLTELGLPTPNLSCGEHNFHSPLEWTCLEEMATAVRVLVELGQVWGEAEVIPPHPL